MLPNPQIPSDLVTFTKEILNGKLHFLSSVTCLTTNEAWVSVNPEQLS